MATTKKKASTKTASRRSASRSTGGTAPGYECGVCGYRLMVDSDCDCAEEHVVMCCDQPMERTSGRSAGSSRTGAAGRSAAKKAPSRSGGSVRKA